MLARVTTLLRWLWYVALAALVVVFATANRDTVTLSLFPLPFVADIPLYLLVLIALFLGLVIGHFAGGMLQLGQRRARLQQEQWLTALRNENAALKAEIAASAAPNMADNASPSSAR